LVLVTAFEQKEDILGDVQCLSTLLMLLLTSALVLMGIFSMDLKPSYEVLEKDNFLTNTFHRDFQHQMSLQQTQ
jgi:hypothetical protein